MGAHPDQLLAVQQSIVNTPGRASVTTLSTAAAHVSKTILKKAERFENAFFQPKKSQIVDLRAFQFGGRVHLLQAYVRSKAQASECLLNTPWVEGSGELAPVVHFYLHAPLEWGRKHFKNRLIPGEIQRH